MKKWLMVLDQVGCSRFEEVVTPVGHATLSTGLWPNEHMIQGRTWCEARGVGMRRVQEAGQVVSWLSG